MTRRIWLERIERIPDVPIAIHVRRRGDFYDAKSPEDYFTKGFMRMPIQWYIDCLRIIRQAVGYPVSAYVVSDDTAAALKELLEVPNVTLVRTGSAIGDMLLLARARVLITTGGSSFSVWAAFLGQMPAISYPGQRLAWWNLKARRGQFQGEFNPNMPPSQFLEQAKEMLR